MQARCLGSRSGLAAIAAAVTAAAVPLTACNAVIDIGDIEFADTAAIGGNGTGGTGTGTAGTGGGGLSAGNGGAAGALPHGEYCINGIDDDGDGDVDCADTDCTAFTCMPAPPAPWEGPAVVYMAPSGGSLPECSGAWTDKREIGNGLNVPTHTCTGCSCDAPSGGTCTTSTLTGYNTQSNCGGSSYPLTPADTNTCYSFSPFDETDSFIASAVTRSTAGSCTPSGGAATIPPVTWDEAGMLCAVPPEDAGGCDASSVCAPAPEAPFESTVCIFQSGTGLTCPPGYPTQIVVAGGYDDTRACSPCTCGAATSESCSATMTVFQGSSCGGTPVNVPTNGSTCVAFALTAPETQASYIFDYTISGGSCSTSGGNATGAATAADEITICCQIPQ